MLQHFILRLLKLFYPIVKKFIPFQVYAYLAVGAANTLLNIGLFTITYYLFLSSSIALEIATVISFITTVLTGFWLNKNFSFINSSNEKKEIQRQFNKYTLVALQGQVSAYLIIKGMIEILDINATVAYVATAVIMLTINYFLQKYFTFKVKETSLIMQH